MRNRPSRALGPARRRALHGRGRAARLTGSLALGHRSKLPLLATSTQKHADPKTAIASNSFWYHTIEVAPGVVTPGWFDLRPIVDRMPWPDLRGKRCLEVGPYDGFLSFEMERRGASEVVATDIGNAADWDWPVRSRVSGPQVVAATSGKRTGGGFQIAKEVLGSSVERLEVSAYDLSPERLGKFDFVVCGSLMLHLRDPIRALEAIGSVCEEHFLSAETISVGLTMLRRRKPTARLRGGERCQWWIPNSAAHSAMLEAAGFAIERRTRPYAIPLGSAHPSRKSALGAAPEHLWSGLVTRGIGVPHTAALCRPTATSDA